MSAGRSRQVRHALRLPTQPLRMMGGGIKMGGALEQLKFSTGSSLLRPLMHFRITDDDYIEWVHPVKFPVRPIR